MKFPCPHCNSMLQAADENRGHPATCGFCGAEFTIPETTIATVLGDLEAGELLARGLNSVSPPSPEQWIPPTVEELQRLLPQYHVLDMIGRGGMGAVYKAAQTRLDREVAIKVLPTELAEDPDFVARFEREARTLARLDHPGIIHVYDFGQTSENHLYFVMEFVDGADLHQLIHGPGMIPAQALEIIGRVCEALQYAHSQGVVHRDIKPANILITKDGRVKLADFGLARPMHANASGRLTLTRVVMGTPDYMAPEQKRGDGDHRVDLYALGVMLYEMLCRKTPQGAWQPPSQRVRVDVRLDQIVIKAMQEEPELRYQQASEIKSDVETVRTTMRPSTASSPARDRLSEPVSRMPGKRRYREAWLPATAILVAGGFILWFLLGHSGKSPAPLRDSTDGLSLTEPPPPNEPSAIPPRDAQPPTLTIEAVRSACAEWKTLPGWNDNRISRDAEGRINLSLGGLPITSLAPLAECKGARFGFLDLNRTKIDDLSPLEELTLERLLLSSSKITSLRPLKNTGLKELDLRELPLTTIAGLESVPLRGLWIYACQIKDLTPLASGKTLTGVRLHSAGPIRDLTPLANHPITQLALRDLPLTTLKGIENLPLESASLTNLPIQDLTPLVGSPLESLTLSHLNRIKDFTPLLRCPNLREFHHEGAIDYSRALGLLRESKLERIAGLPAGEYWTRWDKARSTDAIANTIRETMVKAGTDMNRASITQLGDGTLAVNLYASGFKSLEFLRDAPVSTLYSSNSQLEDISAAPTLKLRHFYMGNNSRIKDYSPLARCPDLEEVELGDPSVDPDPLRGHPKLKYLSHDWDDKANRPAQTTSQFWMQYNQTHGKTDRE